MAGSGTESEQTLQSLLREGYLRIPASGPIRDSVQAVFHGGANFFKLSTYEKMLSRLPKDMGYRPYGVEYSYSADQPDQIESFSVSHRISVGVSELRLEAARILHREMHCLFDFLEPLAEQFVGLLAAALVPSLDTRKYEGALRPWSLLQLNCAVRSEMESDYVSESHEDGCLITVMSNTGPGLEVRRPDGEFVPVELSQEELLIIPGEILSLLSGGTISPTYHRVRAIDRDWRRMALLFFGDLDPRLCVPWISSEINAGVDIGQRVLKSAKRFGLDEWEMD
jgi:isopenicillin N synthase-like dioxygenase